MKKSAMRVIKNRSLIGIVIGFLGSSCWAADEGMISQSLLVDIDNVNTNHYGGSFAILGLRVMEGVNTIATGYASRAGGEGAMATNDNTFVWSDGMLFGSTLPYQFSAYASNGYRLFGGPIYGNGSGLTNLNLSTAVAGSITSDKLAAGAVTSTKLAPGSVSVSAIAAGAVTSASLASGSVGTNTAVMAEWNDWGNGRYMSVSGFPDLVMNPGRMVAGIGLNLMNIATTAAGASQQGYTLIPLTRWFYRPTVRTIGNYAYGASQRGFNYQGTQIIGDSAYGASQMGSVFIGATAINNGAGSLQLLNLGSGQMAYITGSASIGLGACTVTDDQAIVAGDGLVSRGKGTVTALGFYGDGSGLTNLNLSTAVAGSITSDKLASGAVTAAALATGSVGTNTAVMAEWNAWGNGRYMSVSGFPDLVMNPGRMVAGIGLNLTNIAATAFGASQQGYTLTPLMRRFTPPTVRTIGNYAYGASQHGYNCQGTQTIGDYANGASQMGTVLTGATAINNGAGSLQLLNLGSGQRAYITGSASIGLGACTVTDDQAIVAGDGLVSRGKGTVTALGFYGDGSGLTNLNFSSAVPTNSITADKLASGAVTAAKLATGSVDTLAIAAGAVTSASLASGSVGTNKAVMTEWNNWGNARYMAAAGSPDLVLGEPGRIVSGSGMSLMNISMYAYGASQLGLNGGTQTIGEWAEGASQQGENWGMQSIEASAFGALQRGYNDNIQVIESGSIGTSQVGANTGYQTIGNDAYGASQNGYNAGTQTIGLSAYGAEQRGFVDYNASATNTGIGSIQLLNLTNSQRAVVTGHASLSLGACTVTNDQAIVAGDGLASRGKGTITALGFYGNGAGLTNLNFSSAVPTNSITSDKLASGAVTATKLATNSIGTAALATGAVTASKLAVGSVGTNNAVQSEWNAWARAQVPAQTQQVYVATAGTAGAVTGVQSQLLTSALQPASITHLVPYAGAASSVNLGTNSMIAKSFMGDGSGLTNLTVAATLLANSVTTDKLTANAVTTEKLANNSVTGQKIVAGSIVAGHLAAGAVTATTITDGSVTVAKLTINNNLGMGGNRLTNLASPVADEDAVSKAYLRSVLSALPPQGDLSMGSFTNGAPVSFPLTF